MVREKINQLTDVFSSSLFYLIKGITNKYSNQSNSTLALFNEHYSYLKRIIQDVLEFKCENDVHLNYNIHLLENNQLPMQPTKVLKSLQSNFSIICLI